MELVAALLVAAAIFIPLKLEFVLAELPQSQVQVSGSEVVSATTSPTFFWGVGILAIFIVHLVSSSNSVSFLTTAFSHIFTPMLLTGITYYRLARLSEEFPINQQMFQPSVAEGATLVLLTLVLTTGLAYFRKLRHMARFSETRWDFVSKAAWDETSLRMFARLKPLFYPPRRYLVSDHGILIEGLLYLYPLPISIIQSVDGVSKGRDTSDGDYFASSCKEMIAIRLTDQVEPVYISPFHHVDFLKAAAHMVHDEEQAEAEKYETASDVPST